VLPEGAEPWDAAAHGIAVRASGVPTPPIYTYRGSGNAHLRVVQGPERAFVVDVAGRESEPWHVVRVLAYGFFDLAYRETIRHHRTHVAKTTRMR
jgi:hypothetical protein